MSGVFFHFLSWKLFVFIVLEAKSKLSFGFSDISSLTTHFTFQKVQYFFRSIFNVYIHVNELILTPFSLFDIKCKKRYLIWKTAENVLLGHPGESVLHIFPRLYSKMGGCPPIPFRIFVDHVKLSSSRPVQHQRWSSSWQKIGNSWLLADCCYREVGIKCDFRLRH